MGRLARSEQFHAQEVCIVHAVAVGSNEKVALRWLR